MKELEKKNEFIKDKLRKLNNFKMEYEEYTRKEKELKRNINYGELDMKIQGFYEVLEEKTKNIMQHSQVNGHNFTIRFLGKTDLNLPFHIQFFYFIWSVIPNCRVRSF